RSFYTLEIMPWMVPDSAESYLGLIQAIDRKAFAVHFDPVNMICSPRHYFSNSRFIKEFVQKLGGYIKSCHAKDIVLKNHLTVNLDEIRPGLGNLDYRAFLRSLSQLDSDTPLMLEHLSSEDEYQLAAQHIRSVAAEEGLTV
ncbi:MAG: TIM barrel protein, partial [Chloroflexota bacterium]